MDTVKLIDALKQERERITNAIAALEGGTAKLSRRANAKNGRRKRRKLSTAARKKISKAAKARWARVKRAGKNAL